MSHAGEVGIDRHRLQDLVCDGVAARDEPRVGRRVHPPLGDLARRVVFDEQEIRPLAVGALRRVRRTRDLSGPDEFEMLRGPLTGQVMIFMG